MNRHSWKWTIVRNFRTWKERARSFESLAAYNERPTNLLGGDEPIQTTGANVTSDFFRVLRVDPFLGRGFAPAEDGAAAPPLAVLSHGFWQRRFGGQAGVIGRRISIGGTHHEIIGVLPRGFAYPTQRVDLFTNLRAEHSGRDFLVVARLRPGVEPSVAQAEMTGIASVTAAERPGLNAGYSATVTPLHEQTVGRIRPLLRVLFATVLLVLLIACANVSNLLLMRALGRGREMSVRLALGAGRWQLAHLLTVESLVLAGAGGLLGTVTANWGLRALLATLPVGFPLPRVHEIAVDSTVLSFAVLLCVTIGLLFGMVPALFSGRRDLSESLRSGGRSVAPRQRRFRQVMVITEVAVALVLVVGVVADIRHRNPQSKPDPCVFLSNAQLPFPLASLVIRTATDPQTLMSAVKSEIQQVDPDQGVAEIKTMEERVADAGAQPRLQAWLVTAFSLTALALACIGIYGVISYTVTQRTREIGVRLALGADRLRVFGQILRESLAVAGAGIAIGLLASLALTRYLEALLFEIRPIDPVIYASVPILMLIVAAAASYFPSRRAAAVDPVIALREE